ncbi:MAG: SCO family protein [Acidobacteria bacterium]|nr:SCO family protein [Acidobacteriota bacterium]
MTPSPKTRRNLFVLALLGLAGLWLAPAARAEKPRGSEVYFGEIELVDQFGKPHHLYTDLLKDKVVVINAMFTSCTSACPAMAARLAEVQNWLGDRLGKEVYILSISVDPKNDTPAKLLAFAESFRARPGWYFLTGEPENVSQALKKLGQYVDDPEAHQSIMLMGNEPTGLWKKAMGLADAQQLIQILDTVIKDQGPEAQTGQTQTGQNQAGDAEARGVRG